MEPTFSLGATAIVARHFTNPSTSPFDTVEWETRDAWPNTPKYHNPGIEVPKTWSQEALDIVSKLYLAKAKSYTEKSIRQLIERVASQYTVQALMYGYFGNMPIRGGIDSNFRLAPAGCRHPGVRITHLDWVREQDGDHQAIIFYDELCYILLHQFAAFNSPVWFNVGRPDRPQQVSACYILSVDDDTSSIMETARREAFIFKGGSGSGFSVSRIRGSQESLSTGGTASGPVSFMRLWDAGAGTFKSGGTTRRAAKLINNMVDHPDIVDFIECKAREEERLRILAKAGVNIGFDEEGERNVAEVTAYQNANNSVGVTNEFMRKATGDNPSPVWELNSRASAINGPPVDAVEIMDKIVSAAWACADPGLQFMDAMNEMHTTPVLDGQPSSIRSTNPCGEYMSNDDTSCNLASMNILAFLRQVDDGKGYRFDNESYGAAVETMIFAMDVSICFSSSPDDIIAERTQKLRQLGLGYTNMGAAIMAQGWAYDSAEGRDFAASVTALTTGWAYRTSAALAEVKGPFHYFDENRDAMITVIDRHIKALPPTFSGSTWAAAHGAWDQARTLGMEHGYRNAQATVIAPAGSISYLMGCDTTGVEPAFELVSYKELAGGGSMILINKSVDAALRSLRYPEQARFEIVEFLREHGRMPFDHPGAPSEERLVAPGHREVFAGANEIPARAHVLMLAAIQPFVSGGISKTINMPEEATEEDIRDAYVEAWRLGLKGLSIYRNNSKARQVLSSSAASVTTPMLSAEAEMEEIALLLTSSNTWEPGGLIEIIRSLTASQVRRERLPRRRQSVTHKIQVQGQLGEHEGYVTIGFYPDGRVGEMFLEGFGRLGGFTQNALGQWATDFSIALQYGVPLGVLLSKHVGQADETGGMVAPDPDGNPLITRACDSIIDYVVKLVASESGDVDLQEELGIMTEAVKERKMGVDLENLEATGEIAIEAMLPFPTGAAVAALAVSNGNGHARSAITGPTCTQCGKTMRRAGACWQCGCGNTSGGCG